MMRINNGYPIYYFSQKPKFSEEIGNLFDSTLVKKMDEENGDNDEVKKGKGGNQGGKLVSIREGDCVRQYIVNSNGSKVLLSETKMPLTNREEIVIEQQNQSNEATNTKEILGLLNEQVGAILTKDNILEKQ